MKRERSVEEEEKLYGRISMFIILPLLVFFFFVLPHLSEVDWGNNRPPIVKLKEGQILANKKVLLLRFPTTLWWPPHASYVFNDDGSPLVQYLPRNLSVWWYRAQHVTQGHGEWHGYGLVPSVSTDFSWERDMSGSCVVLVDNATEHETELIVDDKLLPPLPAYSHARLDVPVGIHRFSIKAVDKIDSSINRELPTSDESSHIASTHESKVFQLLVESDEKNALYLINFQSANSYRVIMKSYVGNK